MARAEIYQGWLEHDGKVVRINNIKHVLRVSCYEAIYPYPHQVITVHADPKDKSTKYYQNQKVELGDDWSVDVLESNPVLQADILRQLNS